MKGQLTGHMSVSVTVKIASNGYGPLNKFKGSSNICRRAVSGIPLDGIVSIAAQRS